MTILARFLNGPPSVAGVRGWWTAAAMARLVADAHARRGRAAVPDVDAISFCAHAYGARVRHSRAQRDYGHSQFARAARAATMSGDAVH